MRKAVIHSDGASFGNPGESGIGVLVRFEGKTSEISEPIGFATNNTAEYSALIRGLREARRLGAEEAAAYVDSELLARQINGQYRVRNKGLIPLHEEALRLIRSFRRFTISHVPREKNMEADRLSKEAARKGRAPAGKAPRGGPPASPGLFD